jgi:outer membrane protein assembly factor BamB
MTIDQLIFIGLNGYALALNRDTGEIVWSNNELKSGPVTLLLDGDRLIVSTGGYMFCLNPLTGEVLWNNPLSGYGVAAPTAIVSVRGQTSQVLAHTQESDDTLTAAAVTGGVIAASSS